MRIVLCLEYPIGQHGGTEVLVSRLIEGLSGQHEVILVSPDDSTSLARSAAASKIRQHISVAPVWDTACKARLIADQIAAVRPDIIHFHGGGSYAWGNRIFWRCPIFYLGKRVPCLMTNHGAFSIFEGYCWDKRSFAIKLALFLPAWLSKQIVLARARREIAVSQHDYHALRRWYPLARQKFGWLYHSRLAVETLPANVPPDQRKKAVLCVGTIGSRKSQPILVKAFARVGKKFPGWQLVLIGRGGDEPMMAEINEIVSREKLESQVRYLGECPDADVESWLKTAAIFAMPSTYEGLGLSLQEAQFYGCACVATRCGGPEDLIQDGENGLLVPVGDVEGLARVLERLMSDESLCYQFSRRGPRSVLEKDMTVRKMVAAYEKLYAELRSAGLATPSAGSG